MTIVRLEGGRQPLFGCLPIAQSDEEVTDQTVVWSGVIGIVDDLKPRPYHVLVALVSLNGTGDKFAVPTKALVTMTVVPTQRRFETIERRVLETKKNLPKE